MIDFSQKVSIFRNEELDNSFKRDGYVVVPFLSPGQVESLTELYKSVYPNGVKGFFSTTFANNPEHRRKVNQSIHETCKTNLDNIFVDYKVFFSSFIIKAPGKDSELIMHQDMTLVNESIYTGINVWCPLIDLDDRNGSIEVLPGSHRLFHTLRGSSLPDIYDTLQKEVHKYMISCKLKKGEAIIFDQSIIHYSPPNLSSVERPVINTFVAHNNAQIQICYWDKDAHPNQVEIFKQDDDFLEQYENFGENIFNRPTIGTSLGLVDYDFPRLTKEMLDDIYGTRAKPSNWFKRLFAGVS